MLRITPTHAGGEFIVLAAYDEFITSTLRVTI